MLRDGSGLLGYALFAGLGLVAAFLAMRLMRYPPRPGGMSSGMFMPAIFIGAILGAKIPVLISYGLRSDFLWNGKSIFGALLGGFVAMNLVKMLLKVKGHFGDRFVVPLCVGAAIGKLGCLHAGCCAGKPTDFFVSIADSTGVSVHPTQLYEALFQAFLAVVFIRQYRKERLLGSHFLIYLLAYMAFRFCIEFVRTEPRLLLHMTVYQWMAILFSPLFLALLIARLRAKNATAPA